MRRPILLLSVLLLLGAVYYLTAIFTNRSLPIPGIPKKASAEAALMEKTRSKVSSALAFIRRKNLSSKFAFLIDMSQPSGRYRFFVVDLEQDSIILLGLVAHGSCNDYFLQQASFSNTPNSGCSSLGKYKVGYAYKGRFGKSYKLFGLESTNSNAFERAVVLHPYGCVPNQEVYPAPICNSLGCPMVSYEFMNQLKPLIDGSKRPILLWIYQ